PANDPEALAERVPRVSRRLAAALPPEDKFEGSSLARKRGPLSRLLRVGRASGQGSNERIVRKNGKGDFRPAACAQSGDSSTSDPAGGIRGTLSESRLRAGLAPRRRGRLLAGGGGAPARLPAHRSL